MSSSSPHLATLKNIITEIDVVLANQKTFVTPPPQIPPLSQQIQHKTLRNLLRDLDFELEEAQSRLKDLKCAHNGLLSLRDKMTGRERETDNLVFQEFFEGCDYLGKSSELKGYVRKLGSERHSVEDELQSVEDAIAATAPPIPARQLTPPAIQIAQSPVRRNIAKLPAVSLPKFDGDISEWFGFWDHFRILVHNVDPAELPQL
uniref:Uncharacterized protein n=1 Tax=Ditylenchus dipsaci TaxID=166011 RepID=A0A915DBC9_9BILA